MRHINTNFKSHFFLALFLAIWLVLFLIFIAPFDAGDLSLALRFQLMPPYGLIFLISYLILIPIQKWLYERFQGWNIFFELGIIILFFTIGLIGTFLYYKTPIINGDYPFPQFLTSVFTPIFFLIAGFLILARWLLNRLVPMPANREKLILTGANKSDILQLEPSQIVCISSAQNYVEIHFLQQGTLQKQLLRTTLKQISGELPGLIQVHRSHMVNPHHFSKWKDSNTIQLEGLHIPVSKSYRDAIKNYLENRP